MQQVELNVVAGLTGHEACGPSDNHAAAVSDVSRRGGRGEAVPDIGRGEVNAGPVDDRGVGVRPRGAQCQRAGQLQLIEQDVVVDLTGLEAGVVADDHRATVGDVAADRRRGQITFDAAGGEADAECVEDRRVAVVSVGAQGQRAGQLQLIERDVGVGLSGREAGVAADGHGPAVGDVARRRHGQ